MVRALRGATTVDSNTKEEILGATRQLLAQLLEENSLKNDDIVSIMFTATNDIDAAYPAVAAREIGLTDVALICLAEMQVKGSLRMCLRVLITFNTLKNNHELKHVYLKEAVGLRLDLNKTGKGDLNV